MAPTNEVLHVDGQSFFGNGTTAYQQGLNAYRKGNFARAAERFEQVIRLNPSDGAAHNNLGLIFYDERKLVLAAEHFDAAINLLPDDATPLNNLGMTLESGGRVIEALELYDQASFLEPDNPLYLGNALRARIRMGERSELLSEQLEDLAFIETRPEWTSWVDEQLALHRNPSLDRGPAVQERLGSRNKRSTSERPSGLIESEPIELSPSIQLHDGQEQFDSERLPVPAPR